MERGWVKVYRCVDDWDYADKPLTMALLYWLMTHVNYKDNNWHGRLIKRGQIVTSLNSITEKTKLTIGQAKTALKHLKKAGTITIETTNKNSIITLVNYCRFQDCDTSKGRQKKPYKGTQKAVPVHNETTNKQPAENNQTTTNKEKEEIKNLKKENKPRATTTYGFQPIGNILQNLKVKPSADT